MGKTKKKTTQTIYRVACRHKPYAQLGNAMIRDNRLSFEARGVLAYILSHPSNWRFSREWLCKQTKLGKNKSYDLINEMREYGYCQRQQRRKPDGTMGPVEYVFTDEPDAIEPELDPENEPYEPSADDAGAAPQDIVGVDNDAVAENQEAAPPLPGNREAAPPLPGKPLPGQPRPVNREAVYKKETNIVLNKDPPIVPQQAGGRSPTRRPGRTYLPDNWALPDGDRAWALSHAPKIADRIDEEAEAFRDWHAGKRRSDWSARWRTWVREAVKRAGSSQARRVGAATASEGWRDPVPLARGGMVHNTGEPLSVYRDRMIREGKLWAGGAA